MSEFDAAKLFGVHGKVALVTGGSRGIGKMVRLHFLHKAVDSVPVSDSWEVPRSLTFPVSRSPLGLSRTASKCTSVLAPSKTAMARQTN